MLSSAWKIEVITGDLRAPIFQHPYQPSLSDVAGNLTFECVSQPISIKGRLFQHLVVVEDEGSIDPNLEFDAVARELPGVEPASRCLAVADAIVLVEVARRFGNCPASKIRWRAEQPPCGCPGLSGPPPCPSAPARRDGSPRQIYRRRCLQGLR